MRLVNQTTTAYQYRHFGGFRLMLAALVMLQHFAADLAPEPMALALRPYGMGSMAVLAFFALSGFVITEAVDRIYQARPAAFLGNRALRILPHFVLAVAFSMLAHDLFQVIGGTRLWRSQPSFPADAFAPINMAMNFFGIIPMIDRFIPYNFLSITWAVRVEVAFYLVIGACIAAARIGGTKFGFARVATSVMVLLVPLFCLAVRGRGIAMMTSLPYFAFGGGLYFATTGRRSGWFLVALCVPAILWQSLTQPTVSAAGGTPSTTGNLLVLVALLGIMTWLALSKFAGGQRTDRALGNLTYPLYLYHEDVLVVLLTLTTGYSYVTFGLGVVFSVMVVMALMAMVDPLVDRYRDRVRGRALQHLAASRPGMPSPVMTASRQGALG